MDRMQNINRSVLFFSETICRQKFAVGVRFFSVNVKRRCDLFTLARRRHLQRSVYTSEMAEGRSVEYGTFFAVISQYFCVRRGLK